MLPFLSARAASFTVGFERVSVPQPDGPALDGAFWYPSTSPAATLNVGSSELTVAHGGVLAGQHLPLVVMSHGALGAWSGHADTAAALARAGFVVAAVTHAEFSQAGALKLETRPGQLSTLISYALHGWRGHAALDPGRVGAFGYSAGGFTVLVAAGAVPDTSRILSHCRLAPAEWSCTLAARHRLDLVETPVPRSAWIRDGRIKAAVLAAPAAGYLFDQRGLSAVRIPVQLWQASDDRTLAEPWSVTPVKLGLPVRPEFHLVAGADHADFGAPCSAAQMRAAAPLCRDASGFDRAAFHTLFNAAVVEFFRKVLAPPSKS